MGEKTGDQIRAIARLMDRLQTVVGLLLEQGVEVEWKVNYTKNYGSKKDVEK